MQAFWQELRGRTRVTIDRLAGCAEGHRVGGQTIWQAANAAGPSVICYRNAAWQSREGQGDMPGSLRRVVNVGQSVEFFRVA